MTKELQEELDKLCAVIKDEATPETASSYIEVIKPIRLLLSLNALQVIPLTMFLSYYLAGVASEEEQAGKAIIKLWYQITNWHRDFSDHFGYSGEHRMATVWLCMALLDNQDKEIITQLCEQLFKDRRLFNEPDSLETINEYYPKEES